MKVSVVTENVQRGGRMILASDVAKAEATFCWRIRQEEGEVTGFKIWEDACANGTVALEAQLTKVAAIGAEHGYEGLLVVAEPTGRYEELLFDTAIRLGHRVAYVSGEAVALSRTIEFNDTGKTDQRDPQVIIALAERGKLMRYRQRRENYGELKQLHRWYLQVDEERKSLCCQIGMTLLELWPDLKEKKDFYYDKSGQALLKLYGCNPQKVVEAGRKRFERRMRKEVPRVWARTLNRLYDSAEASARREQSPALLSISEEHLLDLNKQYHSRDEVRSRIRGKMVGIYQRMQQEDPRLPDPVAGVINAFGLARFFAETGPLDDFKTCDELMKFAGLNLRERKSGKYVGTNRISKKGSSTLRTTMSRIIFSLIRRQGLFGEEYHQRKASGTPGAKVQTVFMRRMLKILHGWYKSGKAFDFSRVTVCASQHKRGTAA